MNKTMLMLLKIAAITTTGVTAVSLAENIARKATEEYTVHAEPVVMYYSMNKDMTVPKGDTSFKSYMDYTCITNTGSEQYQMQQTAYTDDGLRRYKNGDYMIAMGTYYGEVGDRFIITLDSGVKFNAIMGDIKADCHTDEKNMYYPMNGGKKNVIEFIVDTPELPEMAREMGDISYDGFEGNVISIERIEE